MMRLFFYRWGPGCCGDSSVRGQGVSPGDDDMLPSMQPLHDLRIGSILEAGSYPDTSGMPVLDDIDELAGLLHAYGRRREADDVGMRLQNDPCSGIGAGQ